MIQVLIVGVLFVAAVSYIVYSLIKQSRAKSSCGSAACKCEPNSENVSNVKP